MKPDWKDAPTWANWRARDEDGRWYWYEKKPIMGSLSWIANGRASFALTQYNDWRKSDEERPK